MMRLYFIGISILIIAILANALAMKLGLKTWYAFIEFLTASGDREIIISIIDYIWLFILYPLTLGCGYWLGDKLYQILFN
ncbi:DUF7672 family protein [Winogradskyella jejuensis]|nr:hypothetical protein [Winogradskyella jejuensis]